jgi:hypothetical protein
VFPGKSVRAEARTYHVADAYSSRKQVLMDHVSALERDFAASIPPYLGANVRPANIDDANLKEDLPLISQPDDVYTVGILLSLPHYTSVRSD